MPKRSLLRTVSTLNKQAARAAAAKKHTNVSSLIQSETPDGNSIPPERGWMVPYKNPAAKAAPNFEILGVPDGNWTPSHRGHMVPYKAPAAASEWGNSFNMSTGLALGGVAAGAGLGAIGSYATGGELGQGGVMGGAMAGALMMSGRGLSTYKIGQAGPAGGWGEGLTKLLHNSDNVNYRRAMIGAGGLLGGMAFGGNRTHKSGFNSNRGNTIGR